MDRVGRHTGEVTVVELPEEILIEILSRLPVKSLLAFKTVCKSWYSIINSKQFAKKHLNRAHSARYNQHKDVLGLLIPAWDGSNQCILYNQNSDGIMHIKEFSFPFEVVEVCNYCDGLICFTMPKQQGVLLWNPSRPMNHKIIPVEYKTKSPSELYRFWVGIGYDSTTDDYKVVKVPKCRNEEFTCSFVEVFSLKSSLWSKREIPENMTYMIQQKKSIYTRNRLHWIERHFDGSKEISILCFDMVEEKLDHVNLPRNYKDSLAVIDQNDTLWVLVDYNGIKSSWNPKTRY